MTQLEPAFEGLLPGPTAAQPTSQQTSVHLPTTDHSPVVHIPVTTYDPVLTASDSPSSTAAAHHTPSGGDSVGVAHMHMGEDFPPGKRLRLPSEDGERGFPTEQDIDDFLDQLHQ